MPSADLETLEDAHDHIARLRGAVDKLTEIIGTGTPVMVNTSFTAIDPVSGGPETWHSLGTLAGYTVQAGRYRLTPHNEVQVDVQVTAGGANAASVTFASAMPKPYWPALDHLVPLGSNLNQATGTAWPRLFVSASNGQVQVLQAATSSDALGTTVCIPLD